MMKMQRWLHQNHPPPFSSPPPFCARPDFRSCAGVDWLSPCVLESKWEAGSCQFCEAPMPVWALQKTLIEMGRQGAKQAQRGKAEHSSSQGSIHALVMPSMGPGSDCQSHSFQSYWVAKASLDGAEHNGLGLHRANEAGVISGHSFILGQVCLCNSCSCAQILMAMLQPLLLGLHSEYKPNTIHTLCPRSWYFAEICAIKLMSRINWMEESGAASLGCLANVGRALSLRPPGFLGCPGQPQELHTSEADALLHMQGTVYTRCPLSWH